MVSIVGNNDGQMVLEEIDLHLSTKPAYNPPMALVVVNEKIDLNLDGTIVHVVVDCVCGE